MKRFALVALVMFLGVVSLARGEGFIVDVSEHPLGVSVKWDVGDAAPHELCALVVYAGYVDTRMPEQLRRRRLPNFSFIGGKGEAVIPIVDRGAEATVVVSVKGPGINESKEYSFNLTADNMGLGVGVNKAEGGVKLSHAEGNIDEFRIYHRDGGAMLGSVPKGGSKVFDLEQGVVQRLVAVGFRDGVFGKPVKLTLRRDKGTSWKFINGGHPLNGLFPVSPQSRAGRHLLHVERSGDIYFTYMSERLGFVMGRYKGAKKSWQVRTNEGWTSDHNVPCRPVYDGQFAVRDMVGFTDNDRRLRAITNCITASNLDILDVHGNLHDFAYDEDSGRWVQWMGGADYGRSSTRPLFNAWGGTGSAWDFALNDKDTGLVMHTSYNLGSNKRLIANRIKLGAKDGEWQRWGKEGWAEHTDYSHTYLFNDGKDNGNPRIAPLGREEFLVAYRHAESDDDEFWTALLYDDKDKEWQRLTPDGWAQQGEYGRIMPECVGERTMRLVSERRDVGMFAMLPRGGMGLLVHAKYDSKKRVFTDFEEIDYIAPSESEMNSYYASPSFKLADEEKGKWKVAYSPDGKSIAVSGEGVVYEGDEPVNVISFGYHKRKGLVLFERNGKLYGIREDAIVGESPQKKGPVFREAKVEMPQEYVVFDGRIANLAKDEKGNMPPYWSSPSGRMDIMADGRIVSPHFQFCSTTILNFDNPSSSTYWGGFWDYFLFPMCAAVDRQRGKVYIADRVTDGGGGGRLGGRIQVWDAAEADRCVYKKPGLRKARVEEDYSPERFGSFKWVADMEIDPASGELYVVESLSNTVKVYDIKTEKPELLREFGSDVFYFPRAIEKGPGDVYYVVDGNNHRVVTVNGVGEVQGEFGSFGAGDGKFMYPWDVAYDKASGYVFVSDPLNRRIHVFDTSGKHLSSWTEMPEKRGGPVIRGREQDFSNGRSFALECDGKGNLYVGHGSEILRLNIVPPQPQN